MPSSEQSSEGIPVTVSSTPVNTPPVVYAQPYVSQAPYTPYSEEQRRAASSSYYVIIPFRTGDFDENIALVAALARSMKLLALFDAVLLLLLGIFSLIFLCGLWGPICGYYGAKHYKSSLAYVYAAYWILRTVIDILLVVYGYWWFLLSLCVDMYILSYVWAFARALGLLSEAELNRLRNPPEEMLLVTNP